MPDDEWNVSLALTICFLASHPTVSEPLFTVLLVSNNLLLIEKYWSRARGPYSGTNTKRCYWAGPPTVNGREDLEHAKSLHPAQPDARQFRFLRTVA